MGVPDRNLLKPGKLDPNEWEEMKRHAQCGYEALLRAEQEFYTTEFLRMAREIAYTHHEWWDGTGYPRGLKGEIFEASQSADPAERERIRDFLERSSEGALPPQAVQLLDTVAERATALSDCLLVSFFRWHCLSNCHCEEGILRAGTFETF